MMIILRVNLFRIVTVYLVPNFWSEPSDNRVVLKVLPDCDRET